MCCLLTSITVLYTGFFWMTTICLLLFLESDGDGVDQLGSGRGIQLKSLLFRMDDEKEDDDDTRSAEKTAEDDGSEI